MLIRILDNRKVEKQEEEGTQNENRIVTLNLEVPEDYSSFIKKIVFITEDGNFFDYIENDNTYILKNNITKYRKLKSYIWLTDSSTNKDFRSETFDLEFNDNENPSDYVPSEQEQSQFDLMVEQLEELIEEVEAIPTLSREIVEELPTEDIDPDTIYMVLREDTEPNNIYDEWMYINNAWEKIGSTQVDIKNITDQIEAIEKDLYGEVEETSENGSITLNNSKEDRDIVIDKLYGDTSQETTTGIQMADTNETITETTKNGVTYSLENGVFKFNGTCTGNFYITLTNTFALTSGDYTFGSTNRSGTISGVLGKYVYVQGAGDIYNGQVIENTVTKNLASDYTNCKIRFFLGNNVTFTNYEFKLLLVKGTYTSSTLPTWEKYTGGIASPNPSYPQPIQVVTGTQEVVVRGKNELPNKRGASRTVNGITLTSNNNGSITLNGTSTAYTSFLDTENFIIKAGTYTLSITGITDNSLLAGQIRSTDGQNVYISTSTEQLRTYTFDEDTEVRYRTTVYANKVIDEITIYPMLESGSTVTNYEPYITPTTYQVHLGLLELAKIGTYQDYIYFDVDEGKWYKKGVIRKQTFDGSENWTLSSGWAKPNSNCFYLANSVTMGAFYGGFQTMPLMLSNYYVVTTRDYLNSEDQNNIGFSGDVNNPNLTVRTLKSINGADKTTFETWLGTHNLLVYYALKETAQTTEEITDETLIQDLNELLNLKQFNGTTIIEIDGIPQFHIIYDGNKIENMEDEIEGKLDDSDIATTITSSSTNAKVAGAKAVYDYVTDIVGDINSVLDEINGEVV